MDRRRFLVISLVGALAGRPAAEAQRTGRVARIGYLLLPPLAEKPSAERQAFLDGLRELGYEEGRNVVIEYRSAAWNRELLQELAAELVERKVDVILVAGPQPSLAAREATRSIPIVMIAEFDPVASGLVASFARPGANVTGFSVQIPGLAGKRLALFREAVPHVSSVSVIWNPGNPATAAEWKGTQATARTLGMRLQSIEVRDAKDFLAALQRMAQRPPAAVLMISDTLTVTYREILADFTAKNRIPGITSWREFTEVGGLMSYGATFADLFRRAAVQVDKILKGARPADLPIEQPTKFELVINLKTARALGLTIPRSLLAQADHIIE